MTNQLREGLPPLPPKMAHLHIDERGFPVPYFVQWIDGKPDHRIIDPAKKVKCVKYNQCWLCGQPLGKYLAFVIGPMCAVNRVNSEPPSHVDCARYAVRACPFLSKPHMHRRETGMPENAIEPAGMHLAHNPGAMALWVTTSYKPIRVEGGELYDLGPLVDVTWWHEGREATREEAMAALEKGLPVLRALAEEDGSGATLMARTVELMKLLPP